MSAGKAELGRHLFYDTRLSVNGKQSCASCHRQELAFADGLARGRGTTGEIHSRSSMSLVNVAYAPALTWADPALHLLEPQAWIPMFGTEPVELGLEGQETTLRNIAVTAPYMHDGSIATLEEVIEHYSAGGRAPHPRQSMILRPFRLTAEEKADLPTDPRWRNPWR